MNIDLPCYKCRLVDKEAHSANTLVIFSRNAGSPGDAQTWKEVRELAIEEETRSRASVHAYQPTEEQLAEEKRRYPILEPRVRAELTADTVEYIVICRDCLRRDGSKHILHIGWRYLPHHSPLMQRDEDGYLVNPVLPPNFFNTDNGLRPPAQILEWGNLLFIHGNVDEGYAIWCLDGGAWDRPTWRGGAKTLDEAKKLLDDIAS